MRVQDPLRKHAAYLSRDQPIEWLQAAVGHVEVGNGVTVDFRHRLVPQHCSVELHALCMQAIGHRLSARMVIWGAVAHARLHLPATSPCPPQQWPLNMTGLMARCPRVDKASQLHTRVVRPW